MKKIIIVLCMLLSAFVAFSAFAQDPKVVVVPLNTSRIPAGALPLAWGYVGMTGNLFDNYGVTSVQMPTTGNYTVTLENDFTGMPVVMATAYAASPDDEVVTYSFSAPKTIYLHVMNGGVATSSDISFVVFASTP